MTTPSDPPSGGRRFPRLRRALGVYFDRAREGSSPDELIARHPDLHEHLEPLLAADAEAPLPETGERTLGDFRLMRELGRGGMGVVYEAHQLSLNRRVALKVLPAHLTLLPSAIARFRREALTAARLDHPGIVRILGVGGDGDTHWFAMERIDGAPLDQVLAVLRARGTQAPAPDDLQAALLTALAATGSEASAVRAPASGGYLQAVARIGVQVAEALYHAHVAGIVHRDVKPSNLLLRADGSVVVTDFGLARETGLPSMTAEGVFTGTPFYVSPEQAQGRVQEVGPRSDVFSLGATLYELLTLQLPFPGDNTPAVLEAILRSEPRDPQAVSPRLLPDLAAIVMKALEKQPARRYASAAGLAQDLQAFLEGRPVGARRTSPLARIWRWAQREPLKAVLAGLTLVAIPAGTALTGYVFAQRELAQEGQERRDRDRIEQDLCDGYLALADDRPADAAATFTRVLAAAPEQAEARAGAALAATTLGQRDVALGLVQASDPSQADTLRHLREFLRQVRPDAARHPATEPPPAPPSGPAALFLAGLVEQMRADAIDDLRGARNSYLLFHRAVLECPTARPLYHVSATLAAGHVGVQEARDCASALRRLWPTRVSTWLTIGYALATDGDPADVPRAIEALTKALELAPGDVRVWCRLGLAHLLIGDLPRARTQLERVLARAPDDPRALAGMGMILRATREFDGAIAAGRKATQLRPTRAAFHLELGLTLIAAGQGDAGDREIEAALALNPEHVAALRARAMRRAEDHDLAEAERLLRRALEVQPAAAKSWFFLAQVLLDAGRLEDAIEACRRGLERDPANEPGLVNLGGLLWQNGQREAALTALRAGIALLPRSGPLHEQLVRLLRLARDRDGIAAETSRWGREAPGSRPASAPAGR